jgi:hypothetical protein
MSCFEMFPRLYRCGGNFQIGTLFAHGYCTNGPVSLVRRSGNLLASHLSATWPRGQHELIST